MSDSVTPWTVAYHSPLSGVGCHFLLHIKGKRELKVVSREKANMIKQMKTLDILLQ